MTKTLFVGIDPGQTGGIAFIQNGQAWAYKMPTTERDVLETLGEAWSLLPEHTTVVAFLEKVHAMPAPQKGRPGRGSKANWALGQNYGFLRGCLTALRIPFHDVAPNTWQKALGCQTRGDKNVSKQAAQQLFPDIKITHAIADSLLIAEYGRRMKVQGKL